MIVRVYPVDLKNVEWHQASSDPQTKSSEFGHESTCWQISSTPTIVI